MKRIFTPEIPTEFIDLTNVIKEYNYENSYNYKKLNEFFRLSRTKNLCIFLENRYNIKPKIICKINGKFHTFAHKEIHNSLLSWLNKTKIDGLYRDENYFADYISETFAGIFCFKLQYSVNQYNIDMYCKELKLAIEFDEYQHKYMQNEDKIREINIIKEIKCKFIRHKKGESIFKTINKIINYANSYNRKKLNRTRLRNELFQCNIDFK